MGVPIGEDFRRPQPGDAVNFPSERELDPEPATRKRQLNH